MQYSQYIKNCGNMKNITYGFNRDGVYARCGDKIAYTALDYASMRPENGFASSYSIEDNILPKYEVLDFRSSRISLLASK